MGFCFVCRYDLHAPNSHKRLTKSTISEKDEKHKIVEQRESFHVLLVGHLVLRNLKHAGHGFFNGGEYHTKTLAEADAFLVELGWLKE